MASVSTQGQVGFRTRVLAFVRWVLASLLLLEALVLLKFAADRFLTLLYHPYPTDTLEGTLLYEARLFRAGGSLYPALDRSSFVSAPYPPLHPIFLAQVDRFVGPHLFWSGRMLSFVAACLLGLVTIWLLRTATRSWIAGIFTATLLLSAPPVFLWATRIKPDVFALMWTASGLALATWALLAQGRVASLRLLAAACCFALAFLTKQTALAAPLATGLALLLNDLLAFRQAPTPRRWSRLITPQTWVFGLSYLLLTLGAWALLDLIYAGQYTVHVWWSGDRFQWWSLALFLKFVDLLFAYWPLLLLGGLGAIYGLGRREYRPLAGYALLAPLTLSAAGETGGNHNHLLETLLAYSLNAGIVIGVLLTQPRSDKRRSTLILAGSYLLLVGLIVFQGFQSLNPHPWYRSEITPANYERFVAFMRGTPGEILADDPGLLLLAAKPIRYDDASTMGPAALIGKWDQRGLLDDIANRRFSAIMIPLNIATESTDPAGRWSPEVIAAMRLHYRQLYYDQIITYVPQ